MIEYAIVNFIDKVTKDLKNIIQNKKDLEADKAKIQVLSFSLENMFNTLTKMIGCRLQHNF